MDVYRLRNDIIAYIDVEIATVAHKVARGKCADMSEYNRDCGSILGFEKSKDLVKKLFNAASVEDGDSLE